MMDFISALYNIHEVVWSSRGMRSNSRLLIRLAGRWTSAYGGCILHESYLSRALIYVGYYCRLRNKIAHVQKVSRAENAISVPSYYDAPERCLLAAGNIVPLRYGTLYSYNIWVISQTSKNPRRAALCRSRDEIGRVCESDVSANPRRNRKIARDVSRVALTIKKG